MSDFERHAVEEEARRAVPDRAPTSWEEHRQNMLRRYLGAVATAASSKTGEQAVGSGKATSPRSEDRPPAQPPAAPRVRDVMSVPAVSVPGDAPFLDVAHTLSREHVSAVPVTDADDHVLGVVSESDLLAKAAVTAASRPAGPISRLREHRLYEKSRGETAATLMTFPAISVRPGDLVSDAAWTAARSRVKRLPVTDHGGRLVGVVSRIDLLQALVRDDTEVREEVESRILRHEFFLDPGDFEVTVENGVVTVAGRMDAALIPKLLESVRDIEDVVEVIDQLTGTT
ncbi:hypothetical protein DDE74_01630 [Streptomyces lydicus]|uniref:CBS domain-containing protein n=1 Tax=Streptomyces lydicus TaxID=47763 RepID=A0A3S9Y4A0_9ACTN|nr:CBS domain-containing protein [Streptomyces lydicus]AZS69838.1 hypothetical protein DDE74_01630 [Streptomyces lydicus]